VDSRDCARVEREVPAYVEANEACLGAHQRATAVGGFCLGGRNVAITDVNTGGAAERVCRAVQG
jgi:hypothetical protein